MKSIREAYLKDSSILKAAKLSSFRDEYCVAFQKNKNNDYVVYVVNSTEISNIIGIEESYLKEIALSFNLDIKQKSLFSFENKDDCEKFIQYINEHKDEFITIAMLEEK